jgi:hypothetical protein
MYAGCIKVGHVYTRAGLLQATYTSVNSQKKKIVKQSSREYWYGRPESLLAQTLAETQKKGNKTNLKYPKSIPKNPRDLPSMVANSVVGGKSPYGLALRVL